MKEQIYKVCTQLNNGQIVVTEATEQLLDLFDVSGSAIQVIKWIADCQYTIDQATVPKGGIEAAHGNPSHTGSNPVLTTN